MGTSACFIQLWKELLLLEWRSTEITQTEKQRWKKSLKTEQLEATKSYGTIT